MSGRGEKKEVSYRCKYCKKEYSDRNAFVKHKKNLHWDQISTRSKSAKKQMPRKASSLPPLESSRTKFASPKPVTSRTSGATLRNNSARRENSTTNTTTDQEGHSSLEVESHSDSKSQNLSSLTGQSSEKDSSVTKEITNRPAVKATLGKKMGTRVGLRSSQQGKLVEQTKNRPLPYGKKMKKVDANGQETEEWLRNPTLKGG